MGVWESLFGQRALASPTRNYDQVQATQRRVGSNAKRQEEAHRKLEERVAALETQLAEQADSLERLTSLLLQSNVIDVADLTAMLPKSTIQDS